MKRLAILEVHVTDAETGSPIRFTPVWADTHQTSTDDKGVAKFDIPEGRYTLKIRSPVYEPYSWPIVAPGRYEVKLRRILL